MPEAADSTCCPSQKRRVRPYRPARRVLPLVRQFLYRQWRRDRARLRHRRGCDGDRDAAPRLSGPSRGAGSPQGSVSRRRRHPLHHPTRTRRIDSRSDSSKPGDPHAHRVTRRTSVPLQLGSRPESRHRRASDPARGSQGAQVVLIPELFETPYFCAVQDSRYYDLAHPLSDHPTVANFRRLAADLGVVIPVSVYERAGLALFNSVVIIDADGRVVGHYRKSHIPQAPGYEEKYYFSPGDTGFEPIRQRTASWASPSVGISGFPRRPAPWCCAEPSSRCTRRPSVGAQRSGSRLDGALAYRHARPCGRQHGARRCRESRRPRDHRRVSR